MGQRIAAVQPDGDLSCATASQKQCRERGKSTASAKQWHTEEVTPIVKHYAQLLPPEESSPKPRHAHLVGISGAGMGALADVLLGMGWRLSGSDLLPEASRRLEAAGVRLYAGHAAAHLPSHADLVVASSAVPAENPEIRRAAQLGIPVLTYFQMLGRLMEGKRGLAVAGTHGKSTTTAMAAQILHEAGRDPTVVFGATPIGASSGGRAGRDDIFLVEACEYLANFLHLRPQQAVLLGIEPDHFDCYDTSEALERAFAQFAARTARDGLLLVRHDCPAARRIAASLACRVETFGIQCGADWTARNLRAWRGCYRFELSVRGQPLGRVDLRIPGRHNVLNALAAAALAYANEASPEQILRGLKCFRGLHRRLETLGTWGGVRLIDDYAHHPTEVTASLAAVRAMEPRARVWCVFQPHQASRTARLLDELAESLQNADRVLVADIFRAREGPPQPGEVTAADLARRVCKLKGRPGSRLGTVPIFRAPCAEHGRRKWDCPPPKCSEPVPDLHATKEIEQFLMTQLTPGDVLVTMGAGDIGRIGYGIMDRFRKDRAAG